MTTFSNPITNGALVARLRSYPMTLVHEDPKTKIVYLAGADLRVAANRIEELEQALLAANSLPTLHWDDRA